MSYTSSKLPGTKVLCEQESSLHREGCSLWLGLSSQDSQH